MWPLHLIRVHLWSINAMQWQNGFPVVEWGPPIACLNELTE